MRVTVGPGWASVGCGLGCGCGPVVGAIQYTPATVQGKVPKWIAIPGSCRAANCNFWMRQAPKTGCPGAFAITGPGAPALKEGGQCKVYYIGVLAFVWHAEALVWPRCKQAMQLSALGLGCCPVTHGYTADMSQRVDFTCFDEKSARRGMASCHITVIPPSDTA